MFSYNKPGCDKYTDTFNTPQYIFDKLSLVFNFNFDAACTSKNSKCIDGAFFDLGICGLEASWAGRRVFCNPPFSQKSKWIEKAHKEVDSGLCPVCVMILPLNCMSIASFQDVVIKNGYRYEIPRGRIQFIDDITRRIANGNNSGTVIVYFIKKVEVHNGQSSCNNIRKSV